MPILLPGKTGPGKKKVVGCLIVIAAILPGILISGTGPDPWQEP